MYNILQFVIIGYFLYQAGKLKGLSMATSAALNHKMDKKITELCRIILLEYCIAANADIR